jgi:hypothetical protein
MAATKKNKTSPSNTFSFSKKMAANLATSMATAAASSVATAAAKKLLGEKKMNFLSNTLGTAMTDPFDFLKKSWAGLNSLPKSITPTFDIEELDKRITDMKAVEQWLQLNLNMLQGTIKSMEIQRGTLATIKDLGQSLTPQTASGLAKDLAAGMKETSTAQSATAWWELLQTQFNQVTQAAAATLKPAASTSTANVKSATKKAGAKKSVASTSTAKKSSTKTTAKPKASRTTKARP